MIFVGRTSGSDKDYRSARPFIVSRGRTNSGKARKVALITSRIQIIPRYSETDQSGGVADASYIPWLEIGRASLLKDQGLDYRAFEAKGYWMPVLEAGLTFHHPARYDDTLTLVTTLPSRPSFRIRLEYEIWRDDLLLATGYTVQAFVNRRQQPVKPPPDFMTRLEIVFPRARPTPPSDLQNSTAGP